MLKSEQTIYNFLELEETKELWYGKRYGDVAPSWLISNNTESNQQPCLSLLQFQVERGKLVLSAY